MWNKRLWSGVVVLLAACAQPQPYVRPALPVPTQWPAALGKSG